uniref:Uncharacterized protein n=1 Tax=Heterorhabditis bacteriophora TaxID=37862 RepID=A0A1I7WWB1_HETBA
MVFHSFINSSLSGSSHFRVLQRVHGETIYRL